jgi:thiol:disulfide interchange protein DsbA
MRGLRIVFQGLLLAAGILGGSPGAAADAAPPANWEQGVHYFLIEPPQPTGLPAGKVEVTEVFSFACPACNQFYPLADRLRTSLPAYAQMDYLAAGFRPDEDWPMFQRAFYAAESLGIDARTHDAMFDAVWKTGELAIADPRTNRLKVPPPSIQDAAAFYARAAGVQPGTFLATASSFGVDTRIRQTDQRIRDYRVDSTPTIVVNGKYRADPRSAGGAEQLVELVKWLVAREGPGQAHAATR